MKISGGEFSRALGRAGNDQRGLILRCLLAAQPSPAVAAQEAAPAVGGGAGIGLLAAAATAIGAGLPVKPRAASVIPR
jgi:hypothetical protein